MWSAWLRSFLKKSCRFVLNEVASEKTAMESWKRRKLLQAFERMFKRSARRAVLHIFVEIQIRQGRDDQYVGGKCRQALSGHVGSVLSVENR